MADPPSYPDTAGDTGVGPDRESTAGTPGWVKVFGIALAAVIVLIAVMLLTGHGPGRHLHGALGGHPRPPAVADVRTPPWGGHR